MSEPRASNAFSCRLEEREESGLRRRCRARLRELEAVDDLRADDLDRVAGDFRFRSLSFFLFASALHLDSLPFRFGSLILKRAVETARRVRAG